MRNARLDGARGVGGEAVEPEFRGISDALQMPLERRRDCVEPVRRGEEVFEVPGGLDVLDPDRHDHQPLVHGAFHFTTDMRGPVGVRGEDEQHHARAVDRLE